MSELPNNIESSIHPDILTPDGRVLKWLVNVAAPVSPNANAVSVHNPTANRQAVYIRLQERGVIEFPEMEAKSMSGIVLKGKDVAAYADARLEKSKIESLLYGVSFSDTPSWLSQQDARLKSENYMGELVPVPEINGLVDKWMVETGMEQEVAALQTEIGQRAPGVLHYDLNALMRSMHDQLY